MFVPIAMFSNTAQMCSPEPAPAEAYCMVAWWAFA
jgi:hypothetical protein